MNVDPIESVDALIDLVAAGEGAHDDPVERVDLLAHALQCGHQLARAAPTDVELQVAGLVHDTGHLLVPGEDAGHGVAGGDAVRGLLGDRVARLVELHVPAKRFLVAVDPDYAGTLSPTSTVTLGNQGGPMSAEEVAAFEAGADVASALALRRADEAAKVPGRVAPGLDHWIPVVTRLATAMSAGSLR